jgi:hypothetical protein
MKIPFVMWVANDREVLGEADVEHDGVFWQGSITIDQEGMGLLGIDLQIITQSNGLTEFPIEVVGTKIKEDVE